MDSPLFAPRAPRLLARPLLLGLLPGLLAVLPLHVLATTPVSSSSPPSDEWRFTALLDGKPIGTHRFALQAAGEGARQLNSLAQFEVKLLGFTAYRYRHEVQERWQGDCLASLTARTDDDGQLTEVRGQAAEGGFAVDVRPPPAKAAAPNDARGCLMSFAYWNPALARQRRLLDPGTGRIQPVQISELPAATLDVRGKATPVRGVRITGLAQPIDVWYAGDDWVGLDTMVKGGRRLTYRLL